MSKKIIVFVDDEKPILRALKRLMYPTEFKGFYFENPEKAFEFIQNNPVDMVVSDIKMPEMDGITFLDKIRSIDSSIIRILLSGYSENDRILQTVNSNIAKLYLHKPWDNEELISMIRAVFALYSEITQLKLENGLPILNDLPTLPETYSIISQKIANKESAHSIAQKIEQDVAITARILRVANSAYYGSRTKTIDQAIMMLGLSNVKQIILTQSIMGEASRHAWGDLLWHHAMLTNRILHQVYKLVTSKKIPAYFASCGLLHTLGLVYLLMNDKQNSIYSTLIKDPELSIYPLIEERYGVSSNVFTSFLLEWWDMPIEIIEAAKYYVSASYDHAINPILIKALHISSYYAWKMLDAPQLNHGLDYAVLSELKLTVTDIEELLKKMDTGKE